MDNQEQSKDYQLRLWIVRYAINDDYLKSSF